MHSIFKFWTPHSQLKYSLVKNPIYFEKGGRMTHKNTEQTEHAYMD